MKRHSSKKVTDRPKKAKGLKVNSTSIRKEGIRDSTPQPAKLSESISDRSTDPKSRSTRAQETKKNKDVCRGCSKNISSEERALFVEEEIGRIFCSEECITDFFGPDIQRLEKEYFRRLSPNDLSAEERQTLSHLRWLTLQEPDEIWREKTLSGDDRFTLISEFKPEKVKIWCVCICLYLRGEPSFLYLAFPTRNAAMVNSYRRGEPVEMQLNEQGVDWGRVKTDGQTPALKAVSEEKPDFVDGLADAWTEDETLRAQITRDRGSHDIPLEEFSLYQSCLEETLEAPDEVWSVEMKEHHSLRLYHFLRHYPEENPGVWYIVIARETEDDEQIEILDAFPTRDASLADQFRRGQQEVGLTEKSSLARMVH